MVAFNRVRDAGDGSSGMPPPRHGDDGRIDTVDQFCVEQTPEELTAAEEPDVFSRLTLQIGNQPRHLADDGDLRMIRWLQCREMTKDLTPGIDPPLSPAFRIVSNVLRPMRSVSNRLRSPEVDV